MQPNTNISEFKCAVDAGNVFLKFLGSKNMIGDSDFAKGPKWADFNDFKKVLDSKVNDLAKKKLFSFCDVIEVTQGNKLPKQAKELLKVYHKNGEDVDLDEVQQFIFLKNAHYYVYVCEGDQNWVAYEEPGKSAKIHGITTTSIINRLIMESKGNEVGFIIPQLTKTK